SRSENALRISSSRCCIAGESEPNQRRARRASAWPRVAPSPSVGSGPVQALLNQNSRTLSASSIHSLRLDLIRLEQLLELLGCLARGSQELRLIPFHRILGFQRCLVMLPESAHGRARGS